jgi:hypothetical protein
MSLKEFLSLRHTLAFRLTIWYAGIFAVSLVAAFWVFFIMISSINSSYVDRELLAELSEFSSKTLAIPGRPHKVRPYISWITKW